MENVILDDLRKAKTFLQFLWVVFRQKFIAVTTIILGLLAVFSGLYGSIHVFIKFLILFVGFEGFFIFHYFRFWNKYRHLLRVQKERNANLDESMVETIMKEMKKMRKDTIQLELSFSEGKNLSAGHSKYGGCPDVPEGFEWPFDDSGRPLSFLLQLDCAELSEFDDESLMPKSGHLYFFFELSEMDWYETENSYRVLYYDLAAGPLHRCGFPDSLEDEYRLKESSLCFSRKDSYPCYDYLLPILQNWHWIDEYEAASQRLFYFPDERDGAILGYDNPIQDGMLIDQQNDVLLLEFNSIETNDDYRLLFDDCGCLYFVISREDLIARKFDNIRFEMQSC